MASEGRRALLQLEPRLLRRAGEWPVRRQTTQFGVSGKGRLRRSASGRVCGAGGCATVLSIYNSSPFCGIHQTVLPRAGGPLRDRGANAGGG